MKRVNVRNTNVVSMYCIYTIDIIYRYRYIYNIYYKKWKGSLWRQRDRNR